METASGKETIIVLRRLIAYSEKIFQLSKDIVTLVSDRREKPRLSTAAPPAQVPVDRIVHLGHQRWDIENYGFNELANEWHSDHVFKHDPDASECFLLVAFLAYNIFHVFLARHVKPSVRQGKTQIFWARLIAAELYSEVAPAGMSP
jgi:hypothetical protein